jgi:hypothetical protein
MHQPVLLMVIKIYFVGLSNHLKKSLLSSFLSLLYSLKKNLYYLMTKFYLYEGLYEHITLATMNSSFFSDMQFLVLVTLNCLKSSSSLDLDSFFMYNNSSPFPIEISNITGLYYWRK